MNKLELPHENLVFKGPVEDVTQLQAYSRLMKEYLIGGKMGCRLHTKCDDLLLMFEKDPVKTYNVVYAVGEGLEEQDLWNRVQKILDTGAAEIEVYQEMQEENLEKTILRNFNYQESLMESCRKLDEKAKDEAPKEEEKEAPKEAPKEEKPKEGNVRPVRKFLGYARTVDQVTGYLSLAQEGFSGKNYSRLGLVFSCEGKMPFYLILEKLDDKAGFFVKLAYFRDQVKLSETALAKGHEEYIFGRLKARFKRDNLRPTRIECFDNPPKIGVTNLMFENPIHILALKESLQRKLIRDTRTDLEHDDSDSIEPEDKDTRAMPAEKPNIKLSKDFREGVEDKLKKLFGEEDE